MNTTQDRPQKRALLITAGLALAAYSVPALRRGFGDIFLDTALKALDLSESDLKLHKAYARLRGALGGRQPTVSFRSISLQVEPLGPQALVFETQHQPNVNRCVAVDCVNAILKHKSAIILAWRQALQGVSDQTPPWEVAPGEELLVGAVSCLSVQPGGPETAPTPAVWEGFVAYSRSGNSVRLFLDPDDINPEALRTRVTGPQDALEALARKKWFNRTGADVAAWEQIAHLVEGARKEQDEALRRRAVERALAYAPGQRKGEALSSEDCELFQKVGDDPTRIPYQNLFRILAAEVQRLEALLTPTKQS